MYELLSRMSPGELIGLVATVGGLFIALVVFVTGIVMGIRLEMRRAELAVGLKRDLLERGMTPEEIRTVMEAGLNHPQRLCKSPVDAEV